MTPWAGISEPVLKGFIVGLALTIIAGQLPKLFGVEGGSGNFFEKIWALIGDLGGTSGFTILVGVGSLALILVLKRVAPGVPGSLIAVALGIVSAAAFDLEAHGVDVVGSIESGLPSFGFPDVSVDDLGGLAAGSVGVTLVAFAEGLEAAKNYAARDHYEVDANRELIGLGAAGLGAGLSSGMVVNGSLSKTAVNWSAGPRTQLSGILVAALTVITLLFLTGLFEHLPEAVLAGVVIAAVVELVDIRSLVSLHRVFTRRLGQAYGVAARPDFTAAVAAMLGVMGPPSAWRCRRTPLTRLSRVSFGCAEPCRELLGHSCGAFSSTSGAVRSTGAGPNCRPALPPGPRSAASRCWPASRTSRPVTAVSPHTPPGSNNACPKHSDRPSGKPPDSVPPPTSKHSPTGSASWSSGSSTSAPNSPSAARNSPTHAPGTGT
ncbi:SulP family inorganic anion transporter [Streptomyces sp. SCL15-6]|uniref:SulP family inorganic anion transporter n=1 Tax=Streptomyces sp. SCL15-6 TaxID=2967222 RepID=UPI0029661F9C|nr:SulP family inorganic anion transporter [Streptomyces sp. SCL15-6]